MTSLWVAWREEREVLREWEKFDELLEQHQCELEDHYYTDSCGCGYCEAYREDDMLAG